MGKHSLSPLGGEAHPQRMSLLGDVSDNSFDTGGLFMRRDEKVTQITGNDPLGTAHIQITFFNSCCS